MDLRTTTTAGFSDNEEQVRGENPKTACGEAAEKNRSREKKRSSREKTKRRREELEEKRGTTAGVGGAPSRRAD